MPNTDEQASPQQIVPPPVTQIVERAPKGKSLSLQEINDIVHEVRRRQRAEAHRKKRCD